MINEIIHTFIPRSLTLAGVVIRKFLGSSNRIPVKLTRGTPARVASGFFMGSHYRSPTLLAEQANCELQSPWLLDQVNASIGHQRKFPSGAFLSLFFGGFFSLSLNMNQSTTQL